MCLLVIAFSPASAGAADKRPDRVGAKRAATMVASFQSKDRKARKARRGRGADRGRAGNGAGRKPGQRKPVRTPAPERPPVNAPTPTPTPQPPAPEPITGSGANVPRFGVFTHGSPYDGTVDSIDALQGAIGRDIEIVNWYQSWGGGEGVQQVQPQVIKAVVDSGRTPLLTWEPWDPSAGADQPKYSLRAIADGAHDAYITSWADGLKAIGAEIYLRPMHEMNGTWYPWGANVGDNSPAHYKAAWRRMHRIFTERGATNVKWVWCPLNYDVAGSPMEDWYPGTDVVDILSVDGYNWGSKHEEYGGWQTFEEVFGDAYRRLSALGPQPIWIAEVGAAPDGGDKAAWIRDMWATARNWDRLDAIVWFDQNKEEDWSIMPVASAFGT